MLNQETFTKQLSQLLDKCRREEKESDYFAEELAKLITDYIKTATVTVAIGIPVATASSPSAQTGATTGTGTGTIS